MAGIATPSTHNKYWEVRAAFGNAGAFRQIDLPVAASQTIYAGDVLALSSGKVQQAISLPGSNSTATASGGHTTAYIVGIALAPITTDSAGNETVAGMTRTTIPVSIFDDNLEILMRIYDATATNTQAADLSLGTKYQFQRWRGASATEWWYEAIITTTNGELSYLEPASGTTGNDNYEMAWFKVIPAVRQYS